SSAPDDPGSLWLQSFNAGANLTDPEQPWPPTSPGLGLGSSPPRTQNVSRERQKSLFDRFIKRRSPRCSRSVRTSAPTSPPVPAAARMRGEVDATAQINDP
ncbi:hypothetical protein GOODEAATRI_007804, partial [Goodea atripinnis]